ncbi:MAG: antirestriction protein [Rhodanobacter sp. 68-29]|nr:DUF1738 domain-containing protein [Rhodanobacter sp.]ODU92214.1 MAG: antirestriction protein [Rhodanobacter sp. SCN 66-43]OJY58295.1 MAG: antirestriction protein [Rhodanobacter sp. 68-29]
MAANQIFSDKVAEALIERIQAGTAPWQLPYEESLHSTLPMNPTTGRRYNGINAMWLSITQPNADPRWMTYRQAAEKGWQVRRGEKSTLIECWVFEKQEKDEKTGEKRWVRLDRPFWKPGYVFHASQIDGLPELPVPKHDWDPIERVEALLKESQADIRHEAGATPHYSLTKDRIVMPERGQFLDAGRYAATALHELGHWTGHPSRLNRSMAHAFGSPDYAREELRAEIASYLLGQELGIGHDPCQHDAYLGSWLAALRQDPREIFRACADAEKIVTHVRQFDLYQTQEQTQTQGVQKATTPQPQREHLEPAIARAPRVKPVLPTKAMGMSR